MKALATNTDNVRSPRSVFPGMRMEGENKLDLLLGVCEILETFCSEKLKC